MTNGRRSLVWIPLMGLGMLLPYGVEANTAALRATHKETIYRNLAAGNEAETNGTSNPDIDTVFGWVCPKVSPVTSFDLEKYISRTWYIQMQQVNAYQSANQLYCVAATYELDDRSGPYLKVFNYGNNNEVNGPPQTTQGGTNPFSDLCAKQNPINVADISVAPCIFRRLGIFDYVAGPYWVIAIDPINYEWAIVSGGQPTVRGRWKMF